MVDFITKLPLLAGKDMILVVYNRLSEMTYFVAITKGILAEELAQLFRDNMWKLYRLLKSMISDRRLQFVVDLTMKLNKKLRIKMKLLTSFYLQTNRQTKQINQKLEQYLQFFVDYRQKNQPKWLVIAKFVVNNKTHSVTNISSFIANYGRELKLRTDIKRKEKLEKTI